MMTTTISSVLGGGRGVRLNNCIVKHQQHNHHPLDWSSNNNTSNCNNNNYYYYLSSSSRYMMKGRRMRKRSLDSGLWKAIRNPMNMTPRNMDDITYASPSAPPVFRFQFPTTTTTRRRKNASAPQVMVRFNRRPGGLGGGGWWKEESGKILGNVGVALALAYLSFTGQLGWILDAIVSLWLLAVIVPVVGFGAFLWWASRDMLQGTCPNCQNDFQIFKSMLGDDLQLCPYCTQPFSVVGDKFVQGDINFSSQSQTFDQAFGDFFPPHSKKGSDSSTAVVDVEAEITDAD